MMGKKKMMVDNRNHCKTATFLTLQTSVSVGVFWFAWEKFGFLWGVLYGLFWEIWVGYRMAETLLK